MGLHSVYCVLLLFSLVSLYHASVDICPKGHYCPVDKDCSDDKTQCEQAMCLAGGNLMANWRDTCDNGTNISTYIV